MSRHPNLLRDIRNMNLEICFMLESKCNVFIKFNAGIREAQTEMVPVIGVITMLNSLCEISNHILTLVWCLDRHTSSDSHMEIACSSPPVDIQWKDRHEVFT